LLNALNESQNIHKKTPAHISMIEDLIKCLKTILRARIGIESIAKMTAKEITPILKCLSIKELGNTTRSSVLHILMVLCFAENGHHLVEEAFSIFARASGESSRFQMLVNSLESVQSLDLKVDYLGLINAIVNAPRNLYIRVSIRNEFAELGIERILDALKEKAGAGNDEIYLDLDTQIDTYEDEQHEDTQSLEEKFKHLTVNLKYFSSLRE